MSTPETAAETIVESAALASTALPADMLDRPALFRDKSFIGMAITQFLGAFNDNLYKQLVLLLSIAAGGAAAAEATDEQWLPMLIFAAPFLAFTGYAGYLSDKFGKRGIIILCKIAEIIIMALGGLGFYIYWKTGSLTFLYAVLFLMGMHSALFGPGKYGILPEMLREEDLPRANGFILMLTFLAIIFGTGLAGFLAADGRLWLASASCIVIAVIGTVTSLLVRRLPPANPHLRFEWSALTIPPDMRDMLARDRPLLAALVVSSIFWLLAGMVPSAVNALGKIELSVGDFLTSILTACIGVGIAAGCVIGGLVSHGQVDFRLLRVGIVGMLICLVLAGIPSTGDSAAAATAERAELLKPGVDAENAADKEQAILKPGIGESRQWLGFYASIPVMLLLGISTGLFAVPLQVFMQSRPPKDKKGRMIAVMNQANWIGVLISAGLYWALSKLVERSDWPRCTMFLFIAAMTLPIALFYHPKHDEIDRPSVA
jgi:acyl-[acyl-carrier-protein]-phospholipid O-acyltransferase/long-chain-fatty-acid--[acyl-carrier-protein] ligase